MVPVVRPLAKLSLALLLATVAGGCAAFQSKNQAPSPPLVTGLPKAVPQPITRTSPGAQVAWLSLMGKDGALDLVGIDEAGHQVARLSRAWVPGADDSFGLWRSPNGASILQARGRTIISYSAIDGKVGRSHQRTAGQIIADAFSPDGRYLALLLFESGRVQLEVIDIQTGVSAGVLPVPHDPEARTPGAVSGQSAPWSAMTFGSNSLLYAVSDYGGPARLITFSLDGGKLQQAAASPLELSCGGALLLKVVEESATMAGFCHFDGAVWFVDLKNIADSRMIRSGQPNPMWDSPIFRPDGRVLYLVETGTIRLVDLSRRSLLGPVKLPKAAGDSSLLSTFASLLITTAEAGFIASTMPVSPDGLRLYVAEGDQVLVLDASDLKLLARLPAGQKLGEIWVSGDGHLLYATSEDGRRLLIMASDGSGLHSAAVDLPGFGRFIASEHG
jgi:hypothetical protein